MKKSRIVLIALLIIGAVLAFTYLAPDFGTQGNIRKKGGGDERVYKDYNTADFQITNRATDRQIQVQSCPDLYSSVDAKLNEIKKANTKISKNNNIINGEEVLEIPSAYVDGLNEMDLAISNYNSAYENYKKYGCKNDACNNTIQPLYDIASALYADNVNLYRLYIEIKENKELWSQKYDFQHKKLENELNQQISTKEKNKIIGQMNALNADPEIKDLQKKLQDLDAKRLELQKKRNTSIKDNDKAIKNFETQCKK